MKTSFICSQMLLLITSYGLDGTLHWHFVDLVGVFIFTLFYLVGLLVAGAVLYVLILPDATRIHHAVETYGPR